jgi:PAS domain S-box-containing protein
MKNNYNRKFFNFLLLKKAQLAIHEDDLISRQRFNLFRTFSLTAFLITSALTYQIISIFGHVDFVTIVLGALAIIIALNYFFLAKHKVFTAAYLIAILGSFFVNHFVTYYSGGIRNSGMIYQGGLILAAFMLVGNKNGKLISFLSIANLIFFYIYSETFGMHVRNILDSDGSGQMLNIDYLITYSTGIILIYSLSNNLESSKNIVIEKVTESKVILEKKNEELKKLSLVASSTDNGVIILDVVGKIEWVNEGFTRLTGYSYSEVLNSTTEFLYGPLTDKNVIDEISDRMKACQSFSGEIQKYQKSGATVWVQVTVTPIFDDEGSLSRHILVESDITERKEAEQRMAEYYNYLEKANKELDKFAYVVSHDLKAPLRAISNLATWIEEDIGDKFTEDTKGHFKMLKGRVVRMEALINGILDYSRADRIKSPNVNVDTNEMISEIIEMLIQDEVVEFNVMERMPVLYAEKMKLQQVFSNLISNAIKHNDKESARIQIAFKEESDFYQFSVSDNGPGIEPEFHDKIFVIFQTLKARDAFESTGVGLAIVKKIVEEAGGKIWVESELDKGTQFFFTWPKQMSKTLKPFQTIVNNDQNNKSSLASIAS